MLSACNFSREEQIYLKEDFAFMRGLRFSQNSPLHRKVFGSSYLSYLKQDLKQIVPEGILYQSCHDALICAGGDGVIRVSKRFWRVDLPQVVRASFFIHEMSHLRGSRHVGCDSEAFSPLHAPFSRIAVQGSQECDVDAKGAVGTQIIFLGNISHFCANCDDATKKSAEDFRKFLMKLILTENARLILTNDLLDPPR